MLSLLCTHLMAGHWREAPYLSENSISLVLRKHSGLRHTFISSALRWTRSASMSRAASRHPSRASAQAALVWSCIPCAAVLRLHVHFQTRSTMFGSGKSSHFTGPAVLAVSAENDYLTNDQSIHTTG